MAEQAGQVRGDKEVVARLIDEWVRRTGLKRQALASMAGFPEYSLFYQAYLDMKRPLNIDPDRAIGVVQAVARGLPRERRATCRETLQFLSQTRLPLDRLSEVWPLFSADEWRTAGAALLGPIHDGVTEQSASVSDELREWMARIEQTLIHLERREVGGSGADTPPVDLRISIPVGIPDPAPLPTPHRMPLIRARLFTGREAELHAVSRYLAELPAGSVIAATGIGGIGKTSLASEVVHRFGRFFPGGVFWLNCAEPAAVVREVAACGETGLVRHAGWSELPLEERARLVTLAWQAPLPRLLVFDNCETEATLQRWRPTSGGCRIFLTSRRARWSRSLGVTTLALAELDRGASVALLRAYRPDLPSAEPSLGAIAEELAGLPLALHLAGSYLETYQADPALGDPARLLHDLRLAGPLAHTAMRGVDVAWSATDHELHVERTFALSLGRLDPQSERDATARKLLARAAYAAPGDPLPIDLLLAAGAVGDAGRSGVRRLVDLGLLSEAGDALRIHRLVAGYSRSALADESAAADLMRAIAELTERYYKQRNFPGAALLLPHATLLAAGVRNADAHTIALWNALSFLTDMSGDLAGGLPYLERAYAALQATETLETALGAEVLNNLAELRRFLGHDAPVLPIHRQALAIRERLFGDAHLSVAESYANIGETLRDQGDYAQARIHYERGYAIALKAVGPHDDVTLTVQGFLALLPYFQSDFATARDNLRDLLPVMEQVFGPDDPRTVIARNNLATALLRLGEAGEARQLLEVGINALRRTYGDEYPETLRGRLNLARASAQLGDLTRAAEELRAILGPLATVYGNDHPVTNLARETLADVEAKLGASGTAA